MRFLKHKPLGADTGESLQIGENSVRRNHTGYYLVFILKHMV